MTQPNTISFVLHLYIAGNSPPSGRAVENIKNLCEARLKGCYELSVIDLYQTKADPADGQILATPTLIKRLPLPERRLVGDLSDTHSVLMALDLTQQDQLP
jgi:circadian clock protein KaiB